MTQQRGSRRVPVVRARGELRPTYAQQLLAARASMTAADAVGLVIRHDRRRRQLSQRAYAAMRGWSKSVQGRVETRRGMGAMSLDTAESVLSGTGFVLAVCLEMNEEGKDEPTLVPVPADGWPNAELVARDAAGRRFPAGRGLARRREGVVRWWWEEFVTHPQDRPQPEWTTGVEG